MPMIEHYTDYVIQVLEKTQREYIKRLSVKQSAAEDFTRYADEYLKRTAWSGYDPLIAFEQLSACKR